MQDHQEIQKKLFYYSALVESNPEYVCIEGGNKFKAKAMVLKLQKQLEVGTIVGPDNYKVVKQDIREIEPLKKKYGSTGKKDKPIRRKPTPT